MEKSTRRTLENLVDKANKLKSYGLEKHIRETGFHFYVRQDDSVEFDNIEEEKRDASILTLRLFTQPRDPFSPTQLKKIKDDPRLSKGFRDYLEDAIKDYETFLDGYPSSIKPDFFEEGKHFTNKEIYQVVLYGTIAHVDEDKLQKFEHWTRHDVRKGVLHQTFNLIILGLILWIYALAEKCEEELESNLSGSNI
jgi:hypothetical protein